MAEDAVWVSADKKLQVYVDSGLNAGTNFLVQCQKKH